MNKSDVDVILENAIILIECDEFLYTKKGCMFEALGKASGFTWNKGFGADENAVRWACGNDKPRNTHPAYAAVRLALSRCGSPHRAVMCFSDSANKESKIEMLNLAKECIEELYNE